MQAEPGVVETKTHEWKQEIDLLVDLRNGVSDVLLIISNIVSTPSLDRRCSDWLNYSSDWLPCQRKDRV